MIYSVTQILSPFSKFYGIPPAVLQAAADRGNRIHAAAATYLTGTFQVAALEPADAPYWESLKDWIDSMVDHVYDVEPELKDEKLGFVGHPDLICKINSKFYVVDWKTPQAQAKTWRPQLAAYVHLAGINYRHHSPIWRGMTVQPHPDGKLAKGTPYHHSQQDFGVFLSALNCARYFL